MKRICVYCGSNPGARSEYIDSAIQLGRFLAEKEIELVYGGAEVGLMGAVASETLKNGGKVTGVITEFLRITISIISMLFQQCMREKQRCSNCPMGSLLCLVV